MVWYGMVWYGMVWYGINDDTLKPLKTLRKLYIAPLRERTENRKNTYKQSTIRKNRKMEVRREGCASKTFWPPDGKEKYGMVWYGRVWYGMVWYGMVRYGMVWCGRGWRRVGWERVW